MKLVPLHELFEIRYGNSLELINMIEYEYSNERAIPFVSRTDKNNGISAYVKSKSLVYPKPANTISVAVGGSVLSTFYHEIPYYTGFHVLILQPVHRLTKVEMLFYAKCISVNKYRYNYGRQANKTLKDIKVPSLEDARKFIKDIKIPESPSKKPTIDKQIKLDTSNWKSFKYPEIFDIKKGKRITKQEMMPGSTPFIGSIDSNNGYRGYIINDPIHTENTITVNYNGSVGVAFFQPKPFCASDDCNILYSKNINEYSGLFLVTVIEAERYRFDYGRKWNKARMGESTIKLPATPDGNPDWQFMENYIKSLPYSSNLKD